MEIIKRDLVRGYRVTTFWDHTGDNEGPREYDNLGTMACFHGRYNLGDHEDTDMRPVVEAALDHGLRGTTLARYLKIFHGATTVLPLYLLDHSGLAMRSSSFNDPWDSGYVGVILDTPERREVMGYPKDAADCTDEQRADIERVLQGEVKAYDAHLQGMYAAWKVERPKEWRSGDEVMIEWDEVNAVYGYLCPDWDAEWLWTEAAGEAGTALVKIPAGAINED